MTSDIVGALIAFATGVLVSAINYFLSKQMLIKNAEKYAFSTVIRQVIQVAYIALVYFLSEKVLPFSTTYMLVGSVLGVSLPMFYFTSLLLKLNNSLNNKGKGD